jgi:peptidoglycan hydrolase-like protein with peptidoglycan-binding domain
MARLLFAKGASGEIVRKIQQRLKGKGFDPHGVDGRYGDDTRKAVRRFQTSSHLQPTGEVDVTTWQKLMAKPVPSVRDRALQVTAAFEGHDFTLAQGNFDGAGITWGIIGFTLAHGELSKIVLEIQQQAPQLVKQAFGAKAGELLEIMRAPRARQLAFADSISLGASKARLAEPWRTGFRKLGELQQVQAIQLRHANHDYFQPARRTAQTLRLKTELGLALAFDVHVQNGGIQPEARAEIQRHLAGHPTERELRVAVAHAVANASNPQSRQDVLSRKLTIATGGGKVHGGSFVLRNWGLAELPA